MDYWITLIVASLIGESTAGPCCPDSNAEPVHLTTCATGANFSIDCHAHDMFLLDPDIDEFYIRNDTLYHGSGDSMDSVVPEGQFCTATQVFDGKQKEVAVVCFSGSDWDEEPNTIVKLYSYCLLVSVIFLLVTLAAYCAIPGLRDLQGKAVMAFVLSLSIAYSSLAVMQQDFFGYHVSSDTCVFSGFFTYYWLLCVFFWLHIISFNTWRTAAITSEWPEKHLWTGYLLLGFGGPTLLLFVALVTHHIPGDHIKPNFGHMLCWFPGKLETWTFFYGPMTILLLCNIVYFCLTAMRLWVDYKVATPQPRVRVLRFKWLLYLKLFLTMGISWIFEIISFILGGDWYVTDILNCLQGVTIFIVMVATRRKVLRAIALANQNLCAGYFGTDWQTMEDEESLKETQTEQIQLSKVVTGGIHL